MGRECSRRNILLDRLTVGNINADTTDQFIVFVVEVEYTTSWPFGLGMFFAVAPPALLKGVNDPPDSCGRRRDPASRGAIFLPYLQNLNKWTPIALLGPAEGNCRDAGSLRFEIEGKLLELTRVPIVRVSGIKQQYW